MTPSARIIEPAIALGIIVAGADHVVPGRGRDARAWVALVFGLVHGFGFANVLRQLRLPAEACWFVERVFPAGVLIGGPRVRSKPVFRGEHHAFIHEGMFLKALRGDGHT